MVPIEEGMTEVVGRFGMSFILENLDQATKWLLIAPVLIALLIAVFSLADLIRRGRTRTTALALTRMLSLLAPLLGVYGVCDSLIRTALVVANLNRDDPGLVFPTIALCALFVGVGAVCGCIGVILTAILRIDSARRARKVAP